MREVFNQALSYHKAGRLKDAEQRYRQVLSADPRQPDALHMLGVLAYQTGQNTAAVELIRQAIRLNGNTASYHSNLGLALKDLGRLDEAADSFRKAIALTPDAPEPHNNLGIIFTSLALWEEALACSRKALALKPDFPDAHANIGNVLRQKRQLEAAIASYHTAIKMKPEFPEAHNSLAHALLQTGRFQDGWMEYEWRWQTRSMLAGRRNFTQPIWRGEAAAGRILLIHAEQGFGDTLQFCRLAKFVEKRGLRVILEVQKPLVRLLRDLPGVENVIGRGEELPPFDLHSPLLSLPHALGITVETIPSETPYLRANQVTVKAWSRRLDAIANPGPRIGLAWAGSHTTANATIDQRRSIAPERLAPLLQTPDCKFFSLQKDGPPAPADFPLINVMDEMTDFADTAALIANLDLIISVDTAVTHLAGALGKSVWMLNRFDSCWRWLAGRRDSPWYPKLRIYPQPTPGDWETALAEVTHDLEAFRISFCEQKETKNFD